MLTKAITLRGEEDKLGPALTMVYSKVGFKEKIYLEFQIGSPTTFFLS